MSGHPLYWLAFLTFLIVAAFAIWNLVSTNRRHKHNNRVEAGPGGPNDPLR